MERWSMSTCRWRSSTCKNWNGEENHLKPEIKINVERGKESSKMIRNGMKSKSRVRIGIVGIEIEKTS